MPNKPSSQRRSYDVDNALDTPGKRIRFLRKAKGWNQATLAEKAYTSQPAISQWEHDLWVPTLAFQRALADALDASRSFIFGDEAVSA